MTANLVTREYLDERLGELRGGLRGELRGEMHAIRDDLRSEMRAMEGRLMREIGTVASHFANVVIEQVRTMFAVLADKDAQLASDHAVLRRDFEDHRADPRLHRGPRRRS